MEKRDTSERAFEKWGDAGIAGFQALPDLLLKKQVELGLSPTDMLVLINVLMHWWYRDQRPFPRNITIATRMGIDTRTVQRSIKKMIDLDLIGREEEKTEEGETRTVIDVSKLVNRLSAFAQKDENFLYRKSRRLEA